MIFFNCSKCNEALEAPDSMGGEILQCPKCRFPEKVPLPNDFTIAMEPHQPDASDSAAPSINTFEKGSDSQRKQEFKRPLLKENPNATRLRTFHTRLSNNAMHYLDDQVNEWLDNNPEIEVKFSNTTIGVVEGKKSEAHLIICVWY